MARINEGAFRQYVDGQDRLTAREYMAERELIRLSVNDLDDKVQRTEGIREEFINTVNEVETVKGEIVQTKQEVENKLEGISHEIVQINNGQAVIEEEVQQTSAKLAETIYLKTYAKGDGTDETVKIQEAINASVGKTLYWNKQTGSHYVTRPLFFPSNIHIVFQPGVYIKAATGYTVWDTMFGAKMVDNITIEGNFATIQMLKNEYTEGEQRHAFYFLGCENVVVKDLVIKDSGGDGFMAGGWEVNGLVKTSRNIKFINCVLDNHKRQGISLTGDIEDVLIDGCTVTNTVGIDPQSAIDIEPNTDLNPIRNVTVQNCTLKDNTNGILVYNGSTDIKLLNNRLYNSKGIVVDTFYPNKVRPSVEISGNTIVDSSHIGITVSHTPSVKIHDNTIVNPTNRGIYVDSTLIDLVYNTDIYNNRIIDAKSHGINVVNTHNMKIFNNRVIGTAANRNAVYIQSAIANASYDNQIYNNFIDGGSTGVAVEDSRNSVVKDNDIKSCASSGITVLSSPDSRVTINTVTGCGNSTTPACDIKFSNGTEFNGNKIRKGDKSTSSGLSVDVNSASVTVEDNDFQDSGAVALSNNSATTVIKANKWLDGSYSPYRVTTLPSANVRWIGTNVVKANSGASDTLHVCVKNSAGTPAWVNIETNSTYMVRPPNYLTEASLITDYDINKITTFRVNGENPFNGMSGIITTYRLSGNGWDRQELRKYMSHEVYSRYVDANGAWTPWQKIF